MGLVASGCAAVGYAVTGLCCACSFFKCMCTGAMGSDGVTPAKAKLFYVFFLAIATLTAYLIGRYGEDEVERNAKIGNQEIFKLTIKCEDITGQEGQECSGSSAILRASFASVLFFSFMLIGTIPKPTFSGDRRWEPLFGECFHRGFWGVKILLYFGLLIGSFFMGFFDDKAYTGVARFVSMIFLILQVLVLIDFAYVWNETWLERSGIGENGEIGDAENKGWLYALLSIMGLLFLTAYGSLITMFVFYNKCDETLAFSIVNLLFLVAFLAITYFREDITGEQESFGPAAVVSAYTVYLTFSASTSNPDLSDECDPFGLQLGDNGLDIFIGLAIGTLTLVWTAYTISTNSTSLLAGQTDNAQFAGGGAYEIQEADGTTKYAADAESPQKMNPDAESTTTSDDKLWVFHAIMVTASFYMAMVLTNWGVSQAEVKASGSQVGEISMYVKMAANWAASLLFIWTLIAPAVMPDRDF